MELTRSQELLKEIKRIKKSKKIAYHDIIESIEATGKSVSMTTLRRVFADGSEIKADSFSYENTLMPIANALLDANEGEVPKDVEGLRAVINIQNEEIAMLCDLKEHYEERIAFLISQIEKKDARMDRKDKTIEEKEEAIRQKDELIKKLDEDIRSLLSRCTLCGKMADNQP